MSKGPENNAEADSMCQPVLYYHLTITQTETYTKWVHHKHTKEQKSTPYAYLDTFF